MHKTLMSQKRGVMLFIVLGTLLVVVILASVVLTIILSHSRITHHQVSRIQAYYAAQAGINLALENIRLGRWPSNPKPHDYCLGRSNEVCQEVPAPKRIIDSDMPYKVIISIQNPVDDPECPPANDYCVNAKATYTYTP